MMHHQRSTVIIITGHPATGKTTLATQLAAELQWPLLYKDRIKERLYEVLGGGDRTWHNRLGQASFELIYVQSDALLKANVSHIVEANFVPQYADSPWQTLHSTYLFKVIQILCHADVDTLQRRYHQRIVDGTRHRAHFDARGLDVMWEAMREPAGWLALDGERLFLDTTQLDASTYIPIVTHVKTLVQHVE